MASIIDVSSWPVIEEEPGGADAKVWLNSPWATDRDSKADYWLFKSVKHGTVKAAGGGEPGTYRRADDHAEWLTARLAALLDLPVAEIEYASLNDEFGIISRYVAPNKWDMEEGDLRLLEYDDYVSCVDRPKERLGHSLANIQHLMQNVAGPPGTNYADWNAFDVFAGYLVLDAWIANTDRHAKNWSLMRLGDLQALAKSFDHGSALGSGSDEQRVARDLEAGVATFCRRGYAARFEAGRRLPLVAHAMDAVSRGGAQAGVWIERLEGLSEADWTPHIEQMHGVSVPRARFLGEVLAENRRRLLDVRANP